ncbi:MAG: hypothetical protein WC375_00220 [Methanomassiliicoccales archaeon]|jgi:hypothetical protein
MLISNKKEKAMMDKLPERCSRLMTSSLALNSTASNELFDSYICCGEKMKVGGLEFGNGWLCRKCGKKIYDVASIKMSGNYDAYLNAHVGKEIL